MPALKTKDEDISRAGVKADSAPLPLAQTDGTLKPLRSLASTASTVIGTAHSAAEAAAAAACERAARTISELHTLPAPVPATQQTSAHDNAGDVALSGGEDQGLWLPNLHWLLQQDLALRLALWQFAHAMFLTRD